VPSLTVDVTAAADSMAWEVIRRKTFSTKWSTWSHAGGVHRRFWKTRQKSNSTKRPAKDCSFRHSYCSLTHLEQYDFLKRFLETGMNSPSHTDLAYNDFKRGVKYRELWMLPENQRRNGNAGRKVGLSGRGLGHVPVPRPQRSRVASSAPRISTR
jgi:hypothetical protein